MADLSSLNQAYASRLRKSPHFAVLKTCLKELYPEKHALLHEAEGVLHHAEVKQPDGSKKLVQSRGGPDINLDFANLET